MEKAKKKRVFTRLRLVLAPELRIITAIKFKSSELDEIFFSSKLVEIYKQYMQDFQRLIP